MDRNGLSGYREIQHTADIAIEIWSDSLKGILMQAYEGLVSLIGYQIIEEPVWQMEYNTGAGDFEDQVIGFLNEIIYMMEKNTAVKSIDIKEDDKGRFDIKMTCCRIEKDGLLIKAVTYSGVKLIKYNQSYIMKIVFDV